MSMHLKLKRANTLKKRHFEEVNTGGCNHAKICEQCQADITMLHDLLFTALEPHMDARVAVAAALEQYEKSKQSERH